MKMFIIFLLLLTYDCPLSYYFVFGLLKETNGRKLPQYTPQRSLSFKLQVGNGQVVPLSQIPTDREINTHETWRSNTIFRSRTQLSLVWPLYKSILRNGKEKQKYSSAHFVSETCTPAAISLPLTNVASNPYDALTALVTNHKIPYDVSRLTSQRATSFIIRV